MKSFKEFLNEYEVEGEYQSNDIKKDEIVMTEGDNIDGMEIAKKYYKLHKQIIDNLADR